MYLFFDVCVCWCAGVWLGVSACVLARPFVCSFACLCVRARENRVSVSGTRRVRAHARVCVEYCQHGMQMFAPIPYVRPRTHPLTCRRPWWSVGRGFGLPRTTHDRCRWNFKSYSLTPILASLRGFRALSNVGGGRGPIISTGRPYDFPVLYPFGKCIFFF